MPTTRDIAEVLWVRCLEADHKPGRVQFTKYLYLLDYCHWRFEARQATDAHWIFYHYGPWAEEANAAMNDVAQRYQFSWGEEEEMILRFVRVDEPPERLNLTLENIIQRILRAFKDRDLNALLDFAYNQTEPMLHARRGEALDFSAVPVDRSMPVLTPTPARTAPVTLDPRMAERVARFRENAARLRARSAERQAYRKSDEYHTAMQVLADDLGSGWKLPEHLRAKLTDESAAGLGDT